MAGGKYKENAKLHKYSKNRKELRETNVRQGGVRNRLWQFSEGNTGKAQESSEERYRRLQREEKQAKADAFRRQFEGSDDEEGSDNEGQEVQHVAVTMVVGRMMGTEHVWLQFSVTEEGL
eukprot:CAMPEP_0182878588 /NCGR_PEP_ID=MMETSP0034_2-20130328/15449_1 /TAXON_ID=156128 /ORGANISM="Nephroselmis pyriformis, Strain CCMP717" /LENGTH=119 /DNA_ID=CAMNT_0025011481 /DNA_START=31 /DNA_END=390 /DNA_ORIENTATION=+